MSLKRICYRAGGYARRHDPSRYGSTRGMTPEEAARADKEIFGCLRGCFCTIVFLALIVDGIALAWVCVAKLQEWNRGGLLTFLGGAFLISLVCYGAYRYANRNQSARITFQPPAPLQMVLPQADAEPPTGHEYLICLCRHCNQRIEFPAYGVGTEIECPTCHQTTLLFQPAVPV